MNKAEERRGRRIAKLEQRIARLTALRDEQQDNAKWCARVQEKCLQRAAAAERDVTAAQTEIDRLTAESAEGKDG